MTQPGILCELVEGLEFTPNLRQQGMFLHGPDTSCVVSASHSNIYVQPSTHGAMRLILKKRH
jgi:hypothetical protein